MLYNIYKATASEKQNFNIQALAEYLFIDEITINMNNWLLEVCGLIRIDVKPDKVKEYILPVPPRCTEVPQDVLDRLADDSNNDYEWKNFKLNAVERVRKWKPWTAM